VDEFQIPLLHKYFFVACYVSGHLKIISTATHFGVLTIQLCRKRGSRKP
jgi:hypothetical protein